MYNCKFRYEKAIYKCCLRLDYSDKRKERKKNKKKTKQNYNIPIPISSALLCLRGSRNPRRRNLDVKDRDLEIEKGQAGLP